jgi:hypothetical protein
LDPILSQTNPVQQDKFGQAVVQNTCLDFCRHIPIASSEATPQDNENVKKNGRHPHHRLETKTNWPPVVKKLLLGLTVTYSREAGKVTSAATSTDKFPFPVYPKLTFN